MNWIINHIWSNWFNQNHKICALINWAHANNRNFTKQNWLIINFGTQFLESNFKSNNIRTSFIVAARPSLLADRNLCSFLIFIEHNTKRETLHSSRVYVRFKYILDIWPALNTQCIYIISIMLSLRPHYISGFMFTGGHVKWIDL